MPIGVPSRGDIERALGGGGRPRPPAAPAMPTAPPASVDGIPVLPPPWLRRTGSPVFQQSVAGPPSGAGVRPSAEKEPFFPRGISGPQVGAAQARAPLEVPAAKPERERFEIAVPAPTYGIRRGFLPEAGRELSARWQRAQKAVEAAGRGETRKVEGLGDVISNISQAGVVGKAATAVFHSAMLVLGTPAEVTEKAIGNVMFGDERFSYNVETPEDEQAFQISRMATYSPRENRRNLYEEVKGLQAAGTLTQDAVEQARATHTVWWREMIGQVVFDPLNLLAEGGKVLAQGRRAQEAHALWGVPDIATPTKELVSELATWGTRKGQAKAALSASDKIMAYITPRLPEGMRLRLAEDAKQGVAVVFGAARKRIEGNLLAQGLIKGTEEFAEEFTKRLGASMNAVAKQWARLASDDLDEVAEAYQILRRAGVGDVAASKGGRRTAILLRRMTESADGTLGDLTDAVKYAKDKGLPDEAVIKAWTDKAASVLEELVPGGRFAEMPIVKGAQKLIQRRRPLDALFARLYMGMNLGYAWRNMASNVGITAAMGWSPLTLRSFSGYFADELGYVVPAAARGIGPGGGAKLGVTTVGLWAGEQGEKLASRNIVIQAHRDAIGRLWKEALRGVDFGVLGLDDVTEKWLSVRLAGQGRLGADKLDDTMRELLRRMGTEGGPPGPPPGGAAPGPTPVPSPGGPPSVPWEPWRDISDAPDLIERLMSTGDDLYEEVVAQFDEASSFEDLTRRLRSLQQQYAEHGESVAQVVEEAGAGLGPYVGSSSGEAVMQAARSDRFAPKDLEELGRAIGEIEDAIRISRVRAFNSSLNSAASGEWLRYMDEVESTYMEGMQALRRDQLVLHGRLEMDQITTEEYSKQIFEMYAQKRGWLDRQYSKVIGEAGGLNAVEIARSTPAPQLIRKELTRESYSQGIPSLIRKGGEPVDIMDVGEFYSLYGPQPEDLIPAKQFVQKLNRLLGTKGKKFDQFTDEELFRALNLLRQEGGKEVLSTVEDLQGFVVQRAERAAQAAEGAGVLPGGGLYPEPLGIRLWKQLEQTLEEMADTSKYDDQIDDAVATIEAVTLGKKDPKELQEVRDLITIMGREVQRETGVIPPAMRAFAWVDDAGRQVWASVGDALSNTALPEDFTAMTFRRLENGKVVATRSTMHMGGDDVARALIRRDGTILATQGLRVVEPEDFRSYLQAMIDSGMPADAEFKFLGAPERSTLGEAARGWEPPVRAPSPRKAVEGAGDLVDGIKAPREFIPPLGQAPQSVTEAVEDLTGAIRISGGRVSVHPEGLVTREADGSLLQMHRVDPFGVDGVYYPKEKALWLFQGPGAQYEGGAAWEPLDEVMEHTRALIAELREQVPDLKIRFDAFLRETDKYAGQNEPLRKALGLDFLKAHGDETLPVQAIEGARAGELSVAERARSLTAPLDDAVPRMPKDAAKDLLDPSNAEPRVSIHPDGIVTRELDGTPLAMHREEAFGVDGIYVVEYNQLSLYTGPGTALESGEWAEWVPLPEVVEHTRALVAEIRKLNPDVEVVYLDIRKVIESGGRSVPTSTSSALREAIEGTERGWLPIEEALASTDLPAVAFKRAPDGQVLASPSSSLRGGDELVFGRVGPEGSLELVQGPVVATTGDLASYAVTLQISGVASQTPFRVGDTLSTLGDVAMFRVPSSSNEAALAARHVAGELPYAREWALALPIDYTVPRTAKEAAVDMLSEERGATRATIHKSGVASREPSGGLLEIHREDPFGIDVLYNPDEEHVVFLAGPGMMLGDESLPWVPLPEVATQARDLLDELRKTHPKLRATFTRRTDVHDLDYPLLREAIEGAGKKAPVRPLGTAPGLRTEIVGGDIIPTLFFEAEEVTDDIVRAVWEQLELLQKEYPAAYLSPDLDLGDETVREIIGRALTPEGPVNTVNDLIAGVGQTHSGKAVITADGVITRGPDGYLLAVHADASEFGTKTVQVSLSRDIEGETLVFLDAVGSPSPKALERAQELIDDLQAQIPGVWIETELPLRLEAPLREAVGLPTGLRVEVVREEEIPTLFFEAEEVTNDIVRAVREQMDTLRAEHPTSYFSPDLDLDDEVVREIIGRVLTPEGPANAVDDLIAGIGHLHAGRAVITADKVITRSPEGFLLAVHADVPEFGAKTIQASFMQDADGKARLFLDFAGGGEEIDPKALEKARELAENLRARMPELRVEVEFPPGVKLPPVLPTGLPVNAVDDLIGASSQRRVGRAVITADEVLTRDMQGAPLTVHLDAAEFGGKTIQASLVQDAGGEAWLFLDFRGERLDPKVLEKTRELVEDLRARVPRLSVEAEFPLPPAVSPRPVSALDDALRAAEEGRAGLAVITDEIVTRDPDGVLLEMHPLAANYGDDAVAVTIVRSTGKPPDVLVELGALAEDTALDNTARYLDELAQREPTVTISIDEEDADFLNNFLKRLPPATRQRVVGETAEAVSAASEQMRAAKGWFAGGMTEASILRKEERLERANAVRAAWEAQLTEKFGAEAIAGAQEGLVWFTNPRTGVRSSAYIPGRSGQISYDDYRRYLEGTLEELLQGNEEAKLAAAAVAAIEEGKVPPLGPAPDAVDAARVGGENAARLLDEVLEHAEAMSRWVPPPPPTGPPPPPQAVQDFFEDLMNRYTQTHALASDVSKQARNSALLDYADRRTIDPLIQSIFPWAYWHTRSIPNWMGALITNPAMVANYAKIKYWMKLHNEQDPTIPDWAKGQLVLNPPGYVGSLYLNLEATFNPIQQMLEAYDDPDRERGALGQAIEKLSIFGPAPHPLLALAYAAERGILQGDEDAARSIGYLAPITRAFAAVTGTALEPWLWTRDVRAGRREPGVGGTKWDIGRAGRMLGVAAGEGEVGREAAMTAVAGRTGEIFQEALQESLYSRRIPSLVSLLLGLRVTPRADWEKDLTLRSRQYQALKAQVGSKEAALQTLRDAPWMSTVWMSYDNERERISSLAWDVFGRVPPGYDAQALFDKAGLPKEMREAFYDTEPKGDLTEWNPYDYEAFARGVLNLGDLIKAPEGKTISEWKGAKAARSKLYDTAARQFPQAQEQQTTYWSIANVEGKDAANLYASQSGLFDYWDWLGEQLVADPLLLKYYADEGDSKSVAYSLREQAAESQWPGIHRTQDEYWTLDKPERRGFIQQHPELPEYWDWKDSALEYFTSQLEALRRDAQENAQRDVEFLSVEKPTISQRAVRSEAERRRTPPVKKQAPVRGAAAGAVAAAPGPTKRGVPTRATIGQALGLYK